MYAWLGGILILELARESARDDRQSLRAKILAELEELEETKSVALEIIREVAVGECIVPAVLVERTVLYWANSVLPLVASLKIGTLYNTSARETEHTWMHIEKSLCQVFAHAVLAALPSIGRE